MKCESVRELADLYLYGELEPRQEDDFEQHLHECTACQTAVGHAQTLHRNLDSVRVSPGLDLLTECRRDLFRSRSTETKPSWWASFSEACRASLATARPAGAFALVALGFFAARLTTHEMIPGNQASIMGEPILSTIRSVQPDSSGRVQIAVDETRRRLVTGNLSDGNIERLMLVAVRDESNDGLRVESMEILKQRTGSADVRDALLMALRNDPNPGVRFKALDGLKGMAAEPEVRKTLTYVLQNEQNPGIRVQAIDLLTQHRDAGLVGVLQQLVNKESNSYVRQRCEKVLQELNASVGTF